MGLIFLDEIVAPMGSGCGGLGCLRFAGTADGRRQNDAPECETIGALTCHFPYWFRPDFAQYGTSIRPFPITDAVNTLPIDANLLRAACAPRAVFNSEGLLGANANPFGTQLCYEAAAKVYEFLGVPENNAMHMREGTHQFNSTDWNALLDFSDYISGKSQHLARDINKTFFKIPLGDYIS